MADRVHPSVDHPSVSLNIPHQTEKLDSATTKPVPSVTPKPQPASRTYIVKVPKDQVYRVPSPENARRHEKNLSHKHRSHCCRCCCLSLSLILFLLIAIGVLAAAFYLIIRPKSPNYSVQSISIKGINVTASTFSPEFDVNVRAENPNRQIGIYYRKKSSIIVSYSGTRLCTGSLPSFHQGSNNVTSIRVLLSGYNVILSRADSKSLRASTRSGKIPVDVVMDIPVRVAIWRFRTWTVDVRVHCEVIVDKLSKDSNVISRKCRVKVDPWPL